MANRMTVIAGDTAPGIRVTLRNRDGPQDLTGATVTMRIEKLHNSEASFIRQCDVLDPPTDGRVGYDWEAGETDEDLGVGRYDVEFEVVFGGGEKQTFPTIPPLELRIREPRTTPGSS